MSNPSFLFPLTLLLGLSGCATLPTDIERKVTSHDDRDGEPSRIAPHVAPYLQKHPLKSGFWLLGDGLDAFAARVLLAEAADRTIDVQYYLYHNDTTGRILTYRLLRAADRGVRVRLLLDDMATKGIDTPLASLDAHPNIEVRIVNPYANRGFRGLETLARFDTVTRRMHNKSFSVDNVMTIVGGRNVGDEYFGTHEEVNFGDVDVLAMGPAAAEVGNQFDLYWNSQLAYPIESLAASRGDVEALRRELEEYDEAHRDSPYIQRVRTTALVRDVVAGTLDFQWGHAIVFYDLPDKLLTDPEDRSTHMGPKVLPYTLGALKRDLLIFSPYFVPGEKGVMLLTDLEKRGVQVRVLTNSLASTDVGIVHAGYAKYRKPLLRGGVEIYEFKPDADTAAKGKFAKLKGSSGASLHAKTFVYDREALFVGSPNLDPRSGKLNTELGILFESEPLAKGLADWFDDNQAHIAYRVSLDRSQCKNQHRCEEQLRWTDEEGGREVIYLKDPETGVLPRFFVSLVSLLPIEGQL
jgi:putative cardiolipin synthase